MKKTSEFQSMDFLTEFNTPFGVLCCIDSTDNNIAFRLSPSEKRYNTKVYDLISSKWIPVKPYQTSIIIDTNKLEIGEIYTLHLYGDFVYSFGASDENTIANIITKNGFSMSLGAYDPNDAEKDHQVIPVCNGSVRIGFKEPEQYDITKFHGYLLSVLPDWSGFSFQLLDCTISEIKFRLAWIQHTNTIVAEVSDYENAVTQITTF